VSVLSAPCVRVCVLDCVLIKCAPILCAHFVLNQSPARLKPISLLGSRNLQQFSVAMLSAENAVVLFASIRQACSYIKCRTIPRYEIRQRASHNTKPFEPNVESNSYFTQQQLAVAVVGQHELIEARVRDGQSAVSPLNSHKLPTK
jgi:hypothetical protein